MSEIDLKGLDLALEVDGDGVNKMAAAPSRAERLELQRELTGIIAEIRDEICALEQTYRAERLKRERELTGVIEGIRERIRKLEKTHIRIQPLRIALSYVKAGRDIEFLETMVSAFPLNLTGGGDSEISTMEKYKEICVTVRGINNLIAGLIVRVQLHIDRVKPYEIVPYFRYGRADVAKYLKSRRGLRKTPKMWELDEKFDKKEDLVVDIRVELAKLKELSEMCMLCFLFCYDLFGGGKVEYPHCDSESCDGETKLSLCAIHLRQGHDLPKKLEVAKSALSRIKKEISRAENPDWICNERDRWVEMGKETLPLVEALVAEFEPLCTKIEELNRTLAQHEQDIRAENLAAEFKPLLTKIEELRRTLAQHEQVLRHAYEACRTA